MSNLDRRKFLKQSTKAAAALYLPTLLTTCSTNGQPTKAEASKQVKPPEKLRKIGVALLGLGGYSRGQLAPALQLTEHCELRGIVTGSPEKIPVWQEKYGIPDANVYSYDNLADIANNDDIDVVYVVTPTATHAGFCLEIAAAGKHVWCEKPMAMTVPECQSIIDACRKNGVKLSIGYRMQHEPNTQTVIEYASSKPYGAMQSVLAEAGYGGSIPSSGWRSVGKMGGGALYDMGVYTINGLRYATGLEPIAVRSASRTIPRDVDVTTTYELEFPGGLIASGRTSVVEEFNRLAVSCENGSYELSPMQSYNGVQGKTSDGKLLNIPVQNQQALQMDDNALAILLDTSVLVPGIEGLKDIQIVQAIIKAAASGQAVTIG